MPLDPSHVGRAFPPSRPYQVGREKIREFATAIGATDPAHHDPEAARALGHPDVVAPPTFPTVVALEMSVSAAKEIGIDYSRVVHGDQRFAYTRPIVAGDELVCHPVIEEITSRGGHDFVTTRVDLRTPDGEQIVATWAKLVVRGEG
jgi:acyl dehydratase